MKKIISFIKNKYFYIPLAILVVILLWFTRNGNGKYELAEVKRGDLAKTVSISGKVVASESVDLAFDSSGTVVYVNKNVGQSVLKGEVIASLNTSELRASRDKSYADLLASKAELERVKSSESNQSELLIYKEQVINSMIDAYTVSDDAIRNKVDQYFTDPRTANPEIKYSFDDYFDTKEIVNTERAKVEEMLNRWALSIANLSSSSYSSSDLKTAKTNLAIIKSFLDKLSFAVNSFEVSSDLTQTTIDKYKTDLYTARNNINNSLVDLVSYEDKLRGSTSNVPVLEAKVRAAEASVRGYDAQISKNVIVSPINGIVSVQDAKVGQAVAQNTKVAGVISKGYEIEAYIPEVSISGIQVGNPAIVFLDAYKGEEFKATISHIDPAETEKDGVSNYKIKLSFDSYDAKVLSGMTADVSITTKVISQVLNLEERTTFSESGRVFVQKKVGDQFEKTEVIVGEKDGKGRVEILSGISVGDSVLLNPQDIK